MIKIFFVTSQDLHNKLEKLEEMNQMHSSNKFNMYHTTNIFEDEATKCACPHQESVSYLDTSCKISEGKIIIDLFKKPTDRNMYLLPSSCHPLHQYKNIPMIINRLCNIPETRDLRLLELKDM